MLAPHHTRLPGRGGRTFILLLAAGLLLALLVVLSPVSAADFTILPAGPAEILSDGR
jgi:hypothetical protein